MSQSPQFSVISVDSSHSIELHPDRWRLVQLEAGNIGRVIFEAAAGEPLVTSPDFAILRRLPPGDLPDEAVEGVVLGWSPKLGVWQLGIVFTAEYAEDRGSRWCELARWNDPEATQHGTTANRAAQSLARVLKQPLKVIPPKIEALDAEPVAPLKPLPPLPLSFGVWKLEAESAGLIFRLSGKWSRIRVYRILRYIFWFLTFVVLSTLSLTVKLALPNAGTLLPAPHLLPYMGLAISGVILVLIIKNLLEIMNQPNRVLVNTNTRTVTALRGSRTKWTSVVPNIEGVYASEIIGTRGRQLVSQYGELNLRLDKRTFRNVLVTEDESSLGKRNGRKLQNSVDPLTQNDVQSPLSAAAVYVAQALGDLPAWHDKRNS